MYGTHTLAFQRIFVRMKIISLIFIRFSYVSLIRNGVTGPLHQLRNFLVSDCLAILQGRIGCKLVMLRDSTIARV
jgi:hypothetical protein